MIYLDKVFLVFADRFTQFFFDLALIHCEVELEWYFFFEAFVDVDGFKSEPAIPNGLRKIFLLV
ncbi:hypothetical protein A9976_25290 [Delftia sp. UME58]|nr:hypothetical protein [Delftia sp. UME58]